MEDAGIIMGYKAVVDQSKVGYPIMAYIRSMIPVALLAQPDELARAIPEGPPPLNAITLQEAME